MGFLDIVTNKTSRTASARASLAALKRRRRLPYFSQIDRLPPVFGLVFRRNTYDWYCARHWYFMVKFLNLLHETFNWICFQEIKNIFFPKISCAHGRMCVYKGHYAPANLRSTLINGTVSVLFKKLCQSVLCLIPEYFLFVCFYAVSKVHFSRFAISAGDTAGVGGGGGRFSSVSFLAEEAENCEFLYIKKNTHPLDTLKNRRTFIFVMSEAHNQLLWLWTSSRPKISVKTDLKGGTQFGLNRERGFWFSKMSLMHGSMRLVTTPWASTGTSPALRARGWGVAWSGHFPDFRG